MDDQGFDNLARRLGGLRSRRSALKSAGCGTVAAVFAALGLEQSALAQATIENHCVVRREPCVRKLDCCGARRRSKEIVCDLSNAGSGIRCCGRNRASCFDDTDCCATFACNTAQRCAIP
jgi:hypothetical protein